MSIEVRHIMGMPIEIDVRDEGIDVEPAFAWLRRADELFSTYRADSEISRLGRGELLLSECAPEVDEVLSRCVALRRETDGYFDVRAGGRLDPSGLVKGWAVARAAERLGGVRRLFINAGGDIATRGGPWRIGIRHPVERSDSPRCSRSATWRWPPPASTSAAATSWTRTPAARPRACCR